MPAKKKSNKGGKKASGKKQRKSSTNKEQEKKLLNPQVQATVSRSLPPTADSPRAWMNEVSNVCQIIMSNYQLGTTAEGYPGSHWISQAVDYIQYCSENEVVAFSQGKTEALEAGVARAINYICKQWQVAGKASPGAAGDAKKARPGGANSSKSSDNSIESQIAAQGDVVRKLKAEKADKAIIKAAVDKLLALKASVASGKPVMPSADPVQVQADLVRKLKGDKADKAVIKAAVDKLLALKASAASGAPAAASDSADKKGSKKDKKNAASAKKAGSSSTEEKKETPVVLEKKPDAPITGTPGKTYLPTCPCCNHNIVTQTEKEWFCFFCDKSNATSFRCPKCLP
mmetsp:Transcript_7031/g.13288  ORF Transcript_7031/g.13288 Transcript_7031/m.13288 type:complete len:344 (-) Transcript_7031:92-1123(-)